MQATAQSFRKWAVELKSKAPESRSRKYSFWVVPAPFCAMRFVSDPQYMETDKKGTKTGGIVDRKPKVHCGASTTVSRAVFRNSDLVQVATTRKFKIEKKLSVECGETFMF